MSDPERKFVRVQLSASYVVYADDADMIEEAKSALYEYLMNAVKYDELHHWITVVDAPTATEDEIAGFLLHEEELELDDEQFDV
jgi:hypothetical protein